MPDPCKNNAFVRLERVTVVNFRLAAMMVVDLSEYEGELSVDIFANFMHRRFMMAHIVQEAFIFTMVLSFLSKSRPFLGL